MLMNRVQVEDAQPQGGGSKRGVCMSCIGRRGAGGFSRRARPGGMGGSVRSEVPLSVCLATAA